MNSESIARTLQPTNRARHLPGFVYSSPEIFQAEKELIFMKDWLCLGRVEEIERPGDYMAFRIMGEPVLVCRAQDKRINAFANVCRHRGVELAQGRGNVKEFMCPYHGWLYDLEGKLVGAPYMKEVEGFDIRQCRLKPVRSAVWHGWVFITFDDGAVPFESYIGDFEREFAFLRQEECCLADRYEVQFECNWKLLVENFLDWYHVGTLHIGTIGRFVERMEVDMTLAGKGAVFFAYDAGPQTPGGELLFGKMPWLSDKPDRFSITGLLSPNFNFFARAENVRPFFVWPLTPDRCRLSILTLFPKQYFDHPKFAENVALYRKQLIKTTEEDRSMVESLQNAMKAKNYEPGPMSKLERGVHHFIKYNLDRISPALPA
jgi:choline monooxygenase